MAAIFGIISRHGPLCIYFKVCNSEKLLQINKCPGHNSVFHLQLFSRVHPLAIVSKNILNHKAKKVIYMLNIDIEINLILIRRVHTNAL